MLTMSLGCYKWYQSQTLGDVPMRKLSPEGGRGGYEAVCQRPMLGPEGGGL